MADTVLFWAPATTATDTAGGLVDGGTWTNLTAAGLAIHDVRRNDAYHHALEAVGGLLHTGPTGTNVNDVAVVLLRHERHLAAGRGFSSQELTAASRSHIIDISTVG